MLLPVSGAFNLRSTHYEFDRVINSADKCSPSRLTRVPTAARRRLRPTTNVTLCPAPVLKRTQACLGESLEAAALLHTPDFHECAALGSREPRSGATRALSIPSEIQGGRQ